MPQEWLDRLEIKDGDILIIDDIDKKTIKITKAKVGKAWYLISFVLSQL